jgi:hypothetical protein
MGKWIGQFSKEVQMPMNTWKDVQHPYPSGNANQNNTEIPFHPSLNGNHQNKYLWGFIGKRNLFHCLWECDSSYHCGSQNGVSQETKSRTTRWYCSTSPGYKLKECKSAYNRDTCTPLFIATIVTIAKLFFQPRCPPIDEWIKNKERILDKIKVHNIHVQKNHEETLYYEQFNLYH